MNLLSIAHVPPVQITPDSTVYEAIEASIPQKVGAVAVVDKTKLIGIFTERDVMVKVVHKKLDPQTTIVRDVMTAPVVTIQPDLPVRQVLEMMLDKHIRHLPISSDGKTVQGMLSIRNVLQHMVADLQANLNHMEAYLTADTPYAG